MTQNFSVYFLYPFFLLSVKYWNSNLCFNMIIPLHCAQCIKDAPHLLFYFSPLCRLFFPIITFTSTPASAIFSPSLHHFFPFLFPLISFPVLSLPYLFPPSLIFPPSAVFSFSTTFRCYPGILFLFTSFPSLTFVSISCPPISSPLLRALAHAA